MGAGFKMIMTGEPVPILLGVFLIACIAFFLDNALRNDISDDPPK